MDKNVADTLFRIYQEKISAAAFHGAKKIVSELMTENDQLVLTIRENSVAQRENNAIEDICVEERVKSIKGHTQTICLEEQKNFVINILLQQSH